MKTYRVGYETREPNAIGTFTICYTQVEAETSAEAATKAMEFFHAKGLETRFPSSVDPLRSA